VWQQQPIVPFLETKLWIACIASELALCITLIKRGLLGRYPCLFALAFVNAVRDVGLYAIFGTENPMYARAWVATLPILMSVQVATVLEAYAKLTSQYQGLGAFASKLLRGCLVLLVIPTCVSVAWDAKHFTESILQAVLFMYRYLAFILAGCLALPSLLLWHFPRPQRKPARNITAHLWMLVAYFSVYIIGFFSANTVAGLVIQESKIRIINLFILVILCALYASWAFVLTPEGEATIEWPKLPTDLLALIDARSDNAIQRAKRFKRSGRA
jgi:hypothetical protein